VSAGLVDRRIGLLFATFLALLALAGLRSVQIGVFKGGKLSSAAVTQQVRTTVVPARRGSIVDRNGVALAVSEPASDISATPYLVKDPVRTAAKVASILGLPEDDLVKKLARRDTGFVYLARQVPASKADQLQKLEIPGLQFDPGQPSRLSTRLAGLAGARQRRHRRRRAVRPRVRMNARLRGSDGKRRTVNDALGKPVSVTDPEPAVAGQNLS
jgi:cell division protein FtsI/penicillin-binding protein 2